jgi:hypothetical protein
MIELKPQLATPRATFAAIYFVYIPREDLPKNEQGKTPPKKAYIKILKILIDTYL